MHRNFSVNNSEIYETTVVSKYTTVYINMKTKDLPSRISLIYCKPKAIDAVDLFQINSRDTGKRKLFTQNVKDKENSINCTEITE